MNRFIIADATKCIGCRTCEVACAVSHQENQDCAALSPDEFISRIRVIKDHSWTTAVACHQCEDAPCANVCPVDAISRERLPCRSRSAVRFRTGSHRRGWSAPVSDHCANVCGI